MILITHQDIDKVHDKWTSKENNTYEEISIRETYHEVSHTIGW